MKTERVKSDDFFQEERNAILKRMKKEEIDFEIKIWTDFFQMTLRELVTLQVVLENKPKLDRSETIILKNVDILMEEIKKSNLSD